MVALSSADGGVEWRSPSLTARVYGSIILDDVDGHPGLETAFSRGSNVIVLSGDGGQQWSTAAFAAGEIRTVAAGALGGTGLSIAAGVAQGTSVGQVTVLNSLGGVVNGWPQLTTGAPGYGYGIYNQNLAIADVDNDNVPEIFAPSDVAYVMAFHANGAQLPASAHFGSNKVWSQVPVWLTDASDVQGFGDCTMEHRADFAQSPASIADLDGDGTKEIVVIGDINDCNATDFTSLWHQPYIFSADRTRWKTAMFDWTVLPTPPAGFAPKSTDFNVIQTVSPNPVLADLDGDGQLEILYASYDGRVHAWWLDKTEHGSWPFTVPGTGIQFASEPVVADLDNDGKAEILFGTWGEAASNGTGSLVVLNWKGELLFETPLPAVANTWNGVLGAPTLVNLDNGPELEVVVGTRATGVAVYRIPNSVSTGIRWSTGRGNFRRDGTPVH